MPRIGAIYQAGKWTHVRPSRTRHEVKQALIAAGAEPHRVDGVLVTYWVEDRELIEELADALSGQAGRGVP